MNDYVTGQEIHAALTVGISRYRSPLLTHHGLVHSARLFDRHELLQTTRRIPHEH